MNASGIDHTPKDENDLLIFGKIRSLTPESFHLLEG